MTYETHILTDHSHFCDRGASVCMGRCGLETKTKTHFNLLKPLFSFLQDGQDELFSLSEKSERLRGKQGLHKKAWLVCLVCLGGAFQ